MVPHTLFLVVLCSVTCACTIPTNTFHRRGNLAIRADTQYAAQSQPLKTSGGQCMDVNDLSAGDSTHSKVPIALKGCDGSIGQQWDVITQGQHISSPGFAILVSKKAGTCIDVAAVDGNSPGLFSCGGREDGGGGESNHQLFAWQGGSTVQFADQSGSGQTCLSGGGGRVGLSSCPGQQFVVGGGGGGGNSAPSNSGSGPPSSGNNPGGGGGGSNPDGNTPDHGGSPGGNSPDGNSPDGSNPAGSTLPGSHLAGNDSSGSNGTNASGATGTDSLSLTQTILVGSSAAAGINPSASFGGTGNTLTQTVSGISSAPTGSNKPGPSGAMGKSKHVNAAAIAVPIIIVTLLVVAFLLWRRRQRRARHNALVEANETSSIGQIRVGIARPPKHDYFGFGSNDPTPDSSERHSISQTSMSHDAPISTGGPPQLSVPDLDHLASLVAARIDPTSDVYMNQNQTPVPTRGAGSTGAVNIDDIMSMVAARLDPSFLTRTGGGDDDALSESGDALPSYHSPPVYDDAQAAPRSTGGYRDEKS